MKKNNSAPAQKAKTGSAVKQAEKPKRAPETKTFQVKISFTKSVTMEHIVDVTEEQYQQLAQVQGGINEFKDLILLRKLIKVNQDDLFPMSIDNFDIDKDNLELSEDCDF